MGDSLRRLQSALSDRYAVERELRRGGTADVYLARDLKLQRTVAVKVLRPEYASALGPARFLREIEIAATLSHPHILPVHDSGEHDGLLFYTMPYVAGESLRERIERDRQLPLEDALRITREVAGALQYAHEQGIVHRDVKPANILFEQGHALVADFGIARAISVAADQRLTHTGLAIGTPQYMSPEQGAGEHDVDARSDVYALGCVLYEMLTGEPPFTGRSARAVAVRRVSERPPTVRVVRPDLPEAVEDVVQRALAKAPADRFRSAGEMAAALEGVDLRPRSRRSRRRLVGAAAVIAIVAAAGTAREVYPGFLGSSAVVDSALYVVLPLRTGPGVPAEPRLDGSLHAGFARWQGISFADPARVREAVGDDVRELTVRDAAKLARSLGAGRVVYGELTGDTTSLRLRAALYDTRTEALLADTLLAITRESPDSTLARVAAALLFRGAGSRAVPDPFATATLSFPGRLAYDRGHEAIRRWDLTAADSQFGRATQHEPTFAPAHLWRAYARNWSGVAPRDVAQHLKLALANGDALSSREVVLAQGMDRLAAADYPAACATYDALRQQDPSDFAAWFGLGECRSRDHLVIPNESSLSGWRFRTSYQSAVDAYRNAFAVLAVTASDLATGILDVLGPALYTSTGRMLLGTSSPPASEQFAGIAVLEGDTLVFRAYPLREAGALRTRTDEHLQAVARSRLILQQIAEQLRAAFPASPAALEALAVAMELRGDPAAIPLLVEARAAATDPLQRFRLESTHVWTLVKFGTPGDPAALQHAHALADSVLRRASDGGSGDASRLAALAALLGRVRQAAAFARSESPTVIVLPLPGAVTSPAAALLAYAALGAPTDSIRAYEQQVRAAIRNTLAAQEQEDALHILDRAAMLAFDNSPLDATIELGSSSGHRLLQAQAALASGDTIRARATLEQVRERQSHLPPAERTLDILCPQIQLMLSLGDTASAITTLDNSLNDLRWIETKKLDDVARAASLIRCIALRSALAAAQGDAATAARWDATVKILWQSADQLGRASL